MTGGYRILVDLLCLLSFTNTCLNLFHAAIWEGELDSYLVAAEVVVRGRDHVDDLNRVISLIFECLVDSVVSEALANVNVEEDLLQRHHLLLILSQKLEAIAILACVRDLLLT